MNETASSIVVWDRHRHDIATGATRIAAGDSRELIAPLPPLAPGTYLVLWTSVSADDGHLARGSFLFSVRRRGPVPPHAGISQGSGAELPPGWAGPASILLRWLELLAVTLWVGAAAISAIVFAPLVNRVGAVRDEREYHAVRRIVWMVIPSLLAIGVASLALQSYTFAYDSWSGAVRRQTVVALTASQYGQTWLGRELVLVLALALALAVRGGLTPSRGRLEFTSIQTLVGAAYLWMLSAGGHAASADIGAAPGHEGHLFSLSIGVDWLHLVADVLWLGGQMYIALVLIPILLVPRSVNGTGSFLSALNRFSPFAYLSVVLFSLSGLFNGVVHVPDLHALATSVYGRALIVKMVLVAGMLLLSTVSVYVLRPTIRRSPAAGNTATLLQRLLVSLRLNPLLGAGVLLATSVMFFYPIPPRSGRPAETARSGPGPSAGIIEGTRETVSRNGFVWTQPLYSSSFTGSTRRGAVSLRRRRPAAPPSSRKRSRTLPASLPLPTTPQG